MTLTKSQQQAWDKNKDYWLRRILLQDEINEKDLKKIEKELKKVYKDTSREINKELSYYYNKQQYLSPSEEYQYKQTLKAIEKNLDDMFREEERILNNHLEDKYKEVYSDTSKELGLDTTFHTINNDNVKEAVKTNWSGLTFSERIWGSGKARDILASAIKEELTKGLIRGDSLQDISNRLIDKLNNSFKNAMRLIRTESCNILSKATLDSFKKSDLVSEYEFSAFLDSKTSPQCREMDGKIIKLEKAITGVNLPPLHPNCRSCILPVLGWKKDKGSIKNPKSDNNKILNKKPKYISYKNEDDLLKSRTTKKGKDFIKSLGNREYSALEYYTGDGYMSINEQLRKGIDFDEEDTIKLISDSLKKYKSADNIIVHRGASKKAVKDLFDSNLELDRAFRKYRNDDNISQDELNKKFVGNVIVDKGFMSTTAYEGAEFKKDVTLHINIPKDSNYGGYINELSKYKNREYEYLLDSNLALEIKEAKIENNKLNLYVDILGYAD